MNVSQAAKRLNTTRKTVYKMIDDGRLTATRDKTGRYNISNEAVESLMVRMAKAEPDATMSELKENIETDKSDTLQNIHIAAENFKEAYEADKSENELVNHLDVLYDVIQKYRSIKNTENYLKKRK